ncbi:MAG: alcohol dehydrogenase catalytic domain-containing protein, partial [Sedimentisphaerales bacterium]|nr:alcohol dehydrogenase catalytic domain-containing protein [Sedimentisphaerales bacterium]
MTDLPETQYAVQLVGPDELILNRSKSVPRPGPYQLLCRVEAVGLCFSDLKLLKQFSSHVRKGPVVSGIDLDILNEVPSYVPNEAATIPGHEAVVRIVSMGSEVTFAKPGERFLVQTDYRWLRTATSNGAFGYNFEGALAEYALMDERVITSPEGESMLLPASAELSGSAVALVEPWACVEDAYVSTERTGLKTDGQMLVVVDCDLTDDTFQDLFARYGKPTRITWVSTYPPRVERDIKVERVAKIEDLPDASFDDVMYFGATPETVEALFAKVAGKGLLNIV